MKKAFLLLLTIVLALHVFAQDIISKRNGDIIKAKVLEVNATDIKYKRADNPSSPEYSIPKAEVLSILYENGTKDVFDQTPAPVTTQPVPQPVQQSTTQTTTRIATNDDMAAKGIADAKTYYKGYKPAGNWTFFTSLFLPPVGIVVGICTSSTRPKENTLGYPNYELAKNEAYKSAYQAQAFRIKQKRVGLNMIPGFIGIFGYYLLLNGGGNSGN